MNVNKEQALRDLEALGFRGREVYLAELIPVVEMAWSDGKIELNERALLLAYCEALTQRLNEHAGAPFFTLERTLVTLERLCERPLTPSQRVLALRALKAWAGPGVSGVEMRSEMLSWAQAVAAVGGSPVWDSRELEWLRLMEGALSERPPTPEG